MSVVNGAVTLSPRCQALDFPLKIAYLDRSGGIFLGCSIQKGGAWEEEVAVRVATSRFVDLNIVAPNGNRLSCQKEAQSPVWLNKTCGKVAAAMKALEGLFSMQPLC